MDTNVHVVMYTFGLVLFSWFWIGSLFLIKGILMVQYTKIV